jgi:hypothetical protein
VKGRFGKTWELLEPHARPRLRGFAFVFGLGMVTASCQAYVLWLVKPLIDIVFSESGASSATAGGVTDRIA